MICPVCETENKWKDISELRVKKFDAKGKSIDFRMCEGCGFVTYPSRCLAEKELIEFYKKDYRSAPQAGNLFTGERKLQYHAHFLTPLFEEWNKAGLDSPVVGEIGSAHGMFLNWLRSMVPQADINGTELTETYRRVAFQEFGIKLTHELDKNKKYDLLVSFHVLEHQAKPDKMLKEYAKLLKDNGLFYLSLPIWFRDGNNGATGGFSLEDYWHPDHINSWGEEHIEWIIAKAGLEPVFKDTAVYGNTYLLKKKTSIDLTMPKFDFQKYYDTAKRLYDAWMAMQENNTALAIERYPNCPAAWIQHYELHKAKFHQDRAALDKFLNDCVKACPNSSDALVFKGDILSRYDRYEEAHNAFNLALKKKINNPSILMGLANCYRRRADLEKDVTKKEQLRKDAINIGRMIMATSTEMMPQALSWVYHDEAQMPLPPEPKDPHAYDQIGC